MLISPRSPLSPCHFSVCVCLSLSLLPLSVSASASVPAPPSAPLPITAPVYFPALVPSHPSSFSPSLSISLPLAFAARTHQAMTEELLTRKGEMEQQREHIVALQANLDEKEVQVRPLSCTLRRCLCLAPCLCFPRGPCLLRCFALPCTNAASSSPHMCRKSYAQHPCISYTCVSYPCTHMMYMYIRTAKRMYWILAYCAYSMPYTRERQRTCRHAKETLQDARTRMLFSGTHMKQAQTRSMHGSMTHAQTRLDSLSLSLSLCMCVCVCVRARVCACV